MGQPVIRAKQSGDHGKNPNDMHGCPACPHTVEGPAVTGSPNVTVNSKKVVRLCDRGEHVAKCCNENAWEAIEGSATVYVNGRPVVRRGDWSQHCGGNGLLIGGSPNCIIGGPSVLAPVANASALAEYIQAEMQNNANGPHTAAMRRLTSSWHPYDSGQSLRYFGILTWPASKIDWGRAKIPNLSPAESARLAQWDHKPTIIDQYGKWAYDPATNTSYCYDVWSNIHFGYIGSAAGFSGWTLRNGAGLGQLIAGTSDAGFIEYWKRRFETVGDADMFAAFDDPKDQEALNIGIDLWNKHGKNVTQDDILDAMRASSKLCSRRGMMRC